MKARLVFVGPYGVGKSSLAKALAASRSSAGITFEFEQLVTTRQRRPGEDDSEYLFVSEETFVAERSQYLVVQLNRGVAWSYALKQDRPLPDNTIRLYVVLPETAEFLRNEYPEDTVICAILPPSADVLERRLKGRDATIGADELALRQNSAANDIKLANDIADLVFYNNNGIEASAAALAAQIEQYLTKRSA